MEIIIGIALLAAMLTWLFWGAGHMSNIFNSAWGEGGSEGRRVIPEEDRSFIE